MKTPVASKNHVGPRSAPDAPSVADGIDRICFHLLKALMGIAFVAMLISVFLSVVLRELGYMPFPWLEEASGYLVVWSVFLSAPVLARRNQHISVDIFYEHLSTRGRKVVNVLVAVLGIGVIGYLAYMGWSFTYTAYRFGDMSLSGYIPAWMGYLAIPLGLGLTAVAYLLWLIDLVRPRKDPIQEARDDTGMNAVQGGEKAW